MHYGYVGLQTGPSSDCDAEKMHDESVRPEMRWGGAEATFGGSD